MSLKKSLLAVFSIISMATGNPVLAKKEKNEQDEINKQQCQVEHNKTWYETAWQYSGGIVGTGISYTGKFLTYAGKGLSWGLDKAVIPIRVINEGCKYSGEKLENGTKKVEEKTDLPMKTIGVILRIPHELTYFILDCALDVLIEAPKGTLKLSGDILEGIGNEMSNNEVKCSEEISRIAKSCSFRLEEKMSKKNAYTFSRQCISSQKFKFPIKMITKIKPEREKV